MAISYTMIGVDGQQYGPITLEQLLDWIRDGRVNAATKILRNDMNSWLPASDYPELNLTAPVVVATAPVYVAAPIPGFATTSYPVIDPILFRHVIRGANWFFILAVLIVVNAIALQTHENYYFLMGMGITILIQNLVVNIVIAAIFAALGVFARKRQSWAFIVGMVFYGLDALIFLPNQQWLAIVLHAYVLFWMFKGLQASLQINKLSR